MYLLQSCEYILLVLIATAIPIITILRKKLVESGLMVQTQNCKTSPIKKSTHLVNIVKIRRSFLHKKRFKKEILLY